MVLGLCRVGTGGVGRGKSETFDSAEKSRAAYARGKNAESGALETLGSKEAGR